MPVEITLLVTVLVASPICVEVATEREIVVVTVGGSVTDINSSGWYVEIVYDGTVIVCVVVDIENTLSELYLVKQNWVVCALFVAIAPISFSPAKR